MTTNTLASYRAFAPLVDTSGPFAFTFRIFDSSDMRVILRSAEGVDTVLVSGADYTLSAGPWDSGGTVTTTVAVQGTLGEQVLLKSNVGTDQSTDLTNGDAFDEESVERMLDKAFIVIKQLQEQIGRTFTLQETTALRLALIADPTAANDVLIYNGTTFAFGQLSTLTPGTIVVTAAGLSMVTAADAAAQRALLGVTNDVYLTGIGGTANAITANAPSGVVALAAGQTFKFIVGTTNSGAVTLTIGAFAAKAITMQGSVALKGRELIAGDMVEVTYDGTQFQLGAVDFTRTCSVSAYMTANQSIAAGGPVEVGSGGMTFTELYDTWGDFDSATGRFLCPATGLYQFDFFASLDSQLASATQRFTAYIANETFAAGSVDINGSTANSGSATDPLVIISGGSGQLQLTKGQQRSMWVFHDNFAGTTRILEGAVPDSTKIMIRRVG